MIDENQISSDVQAILLVEDDEAIGDFLTEALKEALPHVVLYVTDAVQALEAVKSIKPVLFLLDYMLPGIDGLELSDRLHAIEGFESVPTLMISANPPDREAIQQRHISFLAKPFELADLIQAVQHLLSAQNA